MELNVIKQDVINELRNQRYYNETEITRLVTTEAIPHKERVTQIAFLVQHNVQLIESVKLMELYFPAAPQQPVVPIAATPAAPQDQQQ
jgi:hypothetical protein